MLRVRDAIDRDYATELDTAALARIAHLSPFHLIRTFAAVFGETPHRYLQRRRVQRAMVLLRDSDVSVTEVCHAVGFSSLGTFSRTFTQVVGEPPSRYRRRGARCPRRRGASRRPARGTPTEQLRISTAAVAAPTVVPCP